MSKINNNETIVYYMYFDQTQEVNNLMSSPCMSQIMDQKSVYYKPSKNIRQTRGVPKIFVCVHRKVLYYSIYRLVVVT